MRKIFATMLLNQRSHANPYPMYPLFSVLWGDSMFRLDEALAQHPFLFHPETLCLLSVNLMEASLRR